MRFTIIVKADKMATFVCEADNVKAALFKAADRIMTKEVVENYEGPSRKPLSEIPKVINPPRLSQKDLDISSEEEAGYHYPKEYSL